MTSSAASRTPALPTTVSTPRLPAASEKTSSYILSAGDPAPQPESVAEVSSETRLGLASIAGTLVAEPMIESEIEYETRDEFPPVWEARNPLLYNLTPPIYSAPFNDLSLFPLNPGARSGLTNAELLEPIAALESAARRNPVAAVTLTVVFAFLTTIGIFAYLSTSGVGELLMSWGQEIWSGSQSQPVSKTPVPPANSAADSSRTGPQ